jgi:hypothetical protein
MQKSERPVALKVVQDIDQRRWHVYVTLPSGAPMDVTGFRNEPAAKAWIKNDSAELLRELANGNLPEDLSLLPAVGARRRTGRRVYRPAG